ncbi:MAG: hypothetical protein ACOC9R_02300 [bacterium]
MSLEERIVAWLPARRDRRRVTTVGAIAVGVGEPVAEVAAVVERLVAEGRVVRTSRHRTTSHHRGMADPPREIQDSLV